MNHGDVFIFTDLFNHSFFSSPSSDQPYPKVNLYICRESGRRRKEQIVCSPGLSSVAIGLLRGVFFIFKKMKFIINFSHGSQHEIQYDDKNWSRFVWTKNIFLLISTTFQIRVNMIFSNLKQRKQIHWKRGNFSHTTTL